VICVSCFAQKEVVSRPPRVGGTEKDIALKYAYEMCLDHLFSVTKDQNGNQIGTIKRRLVAGAMQDGLSMIGSARGLHAPAQRPTS
jgi:hypothetical protein